MKKVGYILITVGFLAGALISVLEVRNVQWGYFIAAFVFGASGIAIVRIIDKRHHRSEGKLSANLQTLRTSLAQIVEKMAELNNQKSSIHVYDMHKRIDASLPQAITAFADARQTIAHAYSLQDYADVMSFFAAGERYLNRAWSCSTDGYVDEMSTYLEKAQDQFIEANDKLSSLAA